MGDGYRKTQTQETDKKDKQRKRHRERACRHGDTEMDTEAERQRVGMQRETKETEMGREKQNKEK